MTTQDDDRVPDVGTIEMRTDEGDWVRLDKWEDLMPILERKAAEKEGGR